MVSAERAAGLERLPWTGETDPAYMPEPPEILPWTGLPDTSYRELPTEPEPFEGEPAEEPAAAAKPEGPITTGPDMTVEEAIPFFSAIYGRDYIDNKSGVVLPASEALMTDFMKLLSRMPAGLTIADVLENMNP